MHLCFVIGQVIAQWDWSPDDWYPQLVDPDDFEIIGEPFVEMTQADAVDVANPGSPPSDVDWLPLGPAHGPLGDAHVPIDVDLPIVPDIQLEVRDTWTDDITTSSTIAPKSNVWTSAFDSSDEFCKNTDLWLPSSKLSTNSLTRTALRDRVTPVSSRTTQIIKISNLSSPKTDYFLSKASEPGEYRYTTNKTTGVPFEGIDEETTANEYTKSHLESEKKTSTTEANSSSQFYFTSTLIEYIDSPSTGSGRQYSDTTDSIFWSTNCDDLIDATTEFNIWNITESFSDSSPETEITIGEDKNWSQIETAITHQSENDSISRPSPQKRHAKNQKTKKKNQSLKIDQQTQNYRLSTRKRSNSEDGDECHQSRVGEHSSTEQSDEGTIREKLNISDENCGEAISTEDNNRYNKESSTRGNGVGQYTTKNVSKIAVSKDSTAHREKRFNTKTKTSASTPSDSIERIGESSRGIETSTTHGRFSTSIEFLKDINIDSTHNIATEWLYNDWSSTDWLSIYTDSSNKNQSSTESETSECNEEITKSKNNRDENHSEFHVASEPDLSSTIPNFQISSPLNWVSTFYERFTSRFREDIEKRTDNTELDEFSLSSSMNLESDYDKTSTLRYTREGWNNFEDNEINSLAVTKYESLTFEDIQFSTSFENKSHEELTSKTIDEHSSKKIRSQFTLSQSAGVLPKTHPYFSTYDSQIDQTDQTIAETGSLKTLSLSTQTSSTIIPSNSEETTTWWDLYFSTSEFSDSWTLDSAPPTLDYAQSTTANLSYTAELNTEKSMVDNQSTGGSNRNIDLRFNYSTGKYSSDNIIKTWIPQTSDYSSESIDQSGVQYQTERIITTTAVEQNFSKTNDYLSQATIDLYSNSERSITHTPQFTSQDVPSNFSIDAIERHTQEGRRKYETSFWTVTNIHSSELEVPNNLKDIYERETDFDTIEDSETEQTHSEPVSAETGSYKFSDSTHDTTHSPTDWTSQLAIVSTPPMHTIEYISRKSGTGPLVVPDGTKFEDLPLITDANKWTSGELIHSTERRYDDRHSTKTKAAGKYTELDLNRLEKNIMITTSAGKMKTTKESTEYQITTGPLDRSVEMTTDTVPIMRSTFYSGDYRSEPLSSTPRTKTVTERETTQYDRNKVTTSYFDATTDGRWPFDHSATVTEVRSSIASTPSVNSDFERILPLKTEHTAISSISTVDASISSTDFVTRNKRYSSKDNIKTDHIVDRKSNSGKQQRVVNRRNKRFSSSTTKKDRPANWTSDSGPGFSSQRHVYYTTPGSAYSQLKKSQTIGLNNTSRSSSWSVKRESRKNRASTDWESTGGDNEIGSDGDNHDRMTRFVDGISSQGSKHSSKNLRTGLSDSNVSQRAGDLESTDLSKEVTQNDDLVVVVPRDVLTITAPSTPFITANSESTHLDRVTSQFTESYLPTTQSIYKSIRPDLLWDEKGGFRKNEIHLPRPEILVSYLTEVHEIDSFVRGNYRFVEEFGSRCSMILAKALTSEAYHLRSTQPGPTANDVSLLMLYLHLALWRMERAVFTVLGMIDAFGEPPCGVRHFGPIICETLKEVIEGATDSLKNYRSSLFAHEYQPTLWEVDTIIHYIQTQGQKLYEWDVDIPGDEKSGFTIINGNAANKWFTYWPQIESELQKYNL